MSDIDMEHGELAGSSTATPKIYISNRTCDAPGAVELTLGILPAFNLLPSEVMFVQLFIDGGLRGHSLIEGSSADRNVTFKVPGRYWRSSQHIESTIHEACFHIIHGTLIRQASSDPTSLTKIVGNAYKVLHRLANQNLHEDNPTDNNEISERSKADDSDHEFSQEQFYDARSQFEHIPAAFPVEEESIVSPAAVGEDSPVDNQHILVSGETGHTTNIATSPSRDRLTRLNRAKREIFQEDNSSGMGAFTASSPPPVNATSAPAQDPDTEMLDDLSEQSEHDEIAPRQKKPMQTFGTIDGFLSSSKTAAQHGINNHNTDPDDEAENLVHNRKPLRRTSFAPAGSALQSDISIDSVSNGKTKQDSLNGKDDSDTEEDEPGATAPSSKTRKDPAKQKAYRTDRAASGARVNTELRKRLADNDKKIGVKGAVLKLWKGKNPGGKSELRAANLRLEEILKKQVKLHNLLIACTDVDAASELRQRLRYWVKGGKIDEYESQVDAIFSAVHDAPSNDLNEAKHQANDDSAEDSNDDFVLPLMSSQQQKMAAALLPEDYSVRRTIETKPRETAASDQQVQPSTSPTLGSGGNNMPEDSDDDDLPDLEDLFRLRAPRESFAPTLPVRHAGKPAERPKKKPRME
ncbi:hypothetical protein MBLNU13_g04899t2 [Cladosporium sp. NU13]